MAAGRCCRIVDPEHGGEVQGVGAAGEGFLELPVDAEPLEGGREARHDPVSQPGQEQASGQVVERAGPSRDDQPPVAKVDVVEVEFPGGLGPGGAGGQGPLAVADAAGGVAEDPPVFLQWPNSERKAVRVCRRTLAGRSVTPSSLSQGAARAASAAARLSWNRPSASVRCRPLLSGAIVTHFLTRSLIVSACQPAYRPLQSRECCCAGCCTADSSWRSASPGSRAGRVLVPGGREGVE